MKIVITGAKSSGKTTVGEQIAQRLGVDFIETDSIIEKQYKEKHGQALSCYEICKNMGDMEFRRYEREAVLKAATYHWCVIATGGSTFMNADLRRILRDNSIVIVLKASPELLWQRLLKRKKSKYLDTPFAAQDAFMQRTNLVTEVIEPFGDIVLDIASAHNLADEIIDRLGEEFAVLSKSPNTIGQVIRLTTFGESHGPAIGAILDGLAAGLPLCSEDIQTELDRRRPGQSKVATTRSEKDRVKILSGVFEGKTTGTPVAMLIENKDQDSSKYEAFRNLFRPGHADFTFWKKYGIHDHRGGGRSSGRETACRVAGGAVAKKILTEYGVRLIAYSREIAGIRAECFDFSVIENNIVRSPDLVAAEKMKNVIIDAQKQGDSVGGIVELIVQGVPAGLGDPVFGKLDARLAQALCSLGAVKGIEFGYGFAAAKLSASKFNDQMSEGKFMTNHAGGILGGISTGQNIVIRLAIKPTPSISKQQDTCDTQGNSQKVSIEGRHDPCIVPRIIPVIEAMAALVILDCWQIQARLKPDWQVS